MSERFIPLRCQSCGGKLDIYDDMERFACGHCGTEMIVLRRGGTVALKVVTGATSEVQAGTDETCVWRGWDSDGFEATTPSQKGAGEAAAGGVPRPPAEGVDLTAALQAAKSKPAPKSLGTCLGVAVVICALGILGAIANLFPHKGSSAGTVDLQATVRFTGTQFVIRNGDSFDWTGVKLEANPGLVSGGYVLNAGRMNSGETYTVGALRFANSDGERFNPFTHKPQKFSISCDTPGGRGFYYATWE
jgi:ribosomal protein S27E